MISKTKKSVTALLMTLSVGMVFSIVMSTKGNFAFADSRKTRSDVVSKIIAAMKDSGTNDGAKQNVTIDYNGTSFKFALYNVTYTDDALLIQNGYLYNVTALNGFESVTVTGDTNEESYVVTFGTLAEVSDLGTDEKIVRMCSADGKSNSLGSIEAADDATNFSIKAANTTITDLSFVYDCVSGDESNVDTSVKGVKFGSDFSLIGTGTETDPFLITCEEDYNILANECCSGRSFEGEYIHLVSDIEVSTPFGTALSPLDGNFSGKKNDEENYSITYHFDSSFGNTYAFGLFPRVACLNNVATVSDLTVYGEIDIDGEQPELIGGIAGFGNDTANFVNCQFYAIGEGLNGYDYVGGIVGRIVEGTLEGCVSFGEINGHYYLGGIAGELCGTVIECGTMADISGSRYIGGIAGTATDAEIYGCETGGTITGHYYLGGIAGDSKDSGLINGSASVTDINGYGYIGGICGDDYVSIDGCNFYGDITATKDCVGGIVGHLSAEAITNCEFDGEIECETAGSKYYGGIVGYCSNKGTEEINNCTSDGRVSANGNYVGGIAGSFYPMIIECINYAKVYGIQYVGGIVGMSKKLVGVDCGISECKSLIETVHPYGSSNTTSQSKGDEDNNFQGYVAGYISDSNTFDFTILESRQ